jgi:hypothetical protein
MASYNYPSAGAAFAQAFTASFTPFLQAKMQQDTALKTTFIEKFANGYDKAKAAYTANNTQQAQYIRDGQMIAQGLTGIANSGNFTQDEIASYAASLVYANKGNVAQAQEQLIDHLSNNLLTRVDISKATNSALKAGASGEVPAPVTPRANAQTDAALGDWSAVAPRIRAGESGSTGGNYDALYAGAEKAGGKFAGMKPTEMTLNQWLEFQDPSGAYGKWVADVRPDKEYGVATPMGAYQIVGTTLRSAASQMGLKGDEIMTAEMQDKIAKHLFDTNGTSPWNGSKYIGNTSATPSATGASGTNLGTLYGLPNLTDVDTANKPLGQQIVDNARSLFSGKDDLSGIREQALVDFKKQLEANGELELYNKIVSGQASLSPFTITSPLALDVSKMNKQDFPNATQLTSPEAIQATRAGVTAGVINATPAQLAMLDAQEAKWGALPFDLPRDLLGLNEQSIRSTYAVVAGLSEEKKKELPEGWLKNLNAIYGTLDEDGKGVTIESITKRLIDESQDAEKLGVFLNGGDFSIALDHALNSMASTKELDAGDRITQLSMLRKRIASMGANDAVLAKVDDALATVRSATELASNPDGDEQRVYIPNADGTDYTIVNVRRTADPASQSGYAYTDMLTNQPVDVTKAVKLSDQLVKEQYDILNRVRQPVTKHNALLDKTNKMLALQGELISIVSKNPEVVKAPFVSGAAAWVDQIRNEVNIGIKKITDIVDNTSMTDEQKTAALRQSFSTPDAQRDAERLRQFILDNETNATTSAAAAFEVAKAKQVLMIYTMGGIEGQSGTAMSNKDFERFRDAITSTTMTSFITNMLSYAEGMKATVDSSLRNLMSDGEIARWEAQAQKESGMSLSLFENKSRPISLADAYSAELGMSDMAKYGYDMLLNGRIREVLGGSPAADTASTPPAATTQPEMELRMENGVWGMYPKKTEDK